MPAHSRNGRDIRLSSAAAALASARSVAVSILAISGLAALAVGIDVPGQRRIEAGVVPIGLGRLPAPELRLEPDVGAKEELLLCMA